MKTRIFISLIMVLSWLASSVVAVLQGTAFNYHGRLDTNGVPYTGNAEFQPTLWDAPTAGTQVAANNPATVIVGVTNGLFVLPLDFGAAFPGAERWLQLEVRTATGPFTVLWPRQQLTPTPYAITAGNLSGTLPAAQLVGTLPGANLGGTYWGAVTFNNPANSFTGTFSGNGAGLTSLDASQLSGGTVPDERLNTNIARTDQVWLVSGNAGTTAGKHFLGTTDDQPLEFKVNRLRALRLENNGDGADEDSTPDGAPNVIGGSLVNYAGAGVVGATISGGGATNYYDSARANVVLADYGTVGGGLGNRIEAGSTSAAIAGGAENAIGTNATYSAIGGGYGNTIQTDAYYATVGGGGWNTIQTHAVEATVGGGYGNTIQTNASWGTIGGGRGTRSGPRLALPQSAGAIRTRSRPTLPGPQSAGAIATPSTQTGDMRRSRAVTATPPPTTPLPQAAVPRPTTPARLYGPTRPTRISPRPPTTSF